MALGLKIAVLMGFNADIFVQKVLRGSILCYKCKIDFLKGNGGEIVKFQYKYTPVPKFFCSWH